MSAQHTERSHEAAAPGDVVVVTGHRIGEHERTGEILELIGDRAHPRYRVRWDDGHESIFSPSSDAFVRHSQRGNKEET